MQILRRTALTGLLVSVAACGGGSSDAPATSTSNPPGIGVTLKGSRMLGIDVQDQAAGVDFGQAVSLARDLGAEHVTLQVSWNWFEPTSASTCTEPGEFIDAGGLLANTHASFAILRDNGLEPKLSLTVNPISTNGWHLPDNFDSANFSLPPADVTAEVSLVACRFNAFMDYVTMMLLFGGEETPGETPALQLFNVQIGNEMDLSTDRGDANFWDNYYDFFQETSAHTRNRLAELGAGQVGVSTTTTVYGLIGRQGAVQADNIRRIYENLADHVAVTYYPLEEIDLENSSGFQVKTAAEAVAELDALVSTVEDMSLDAGRRLPLHFQEVGFPSGTLNDSSASAQAQFYAQFLEFWDRNATEVDSATIIRLYDLSTTEAQASTRFFFGDPPTVADPIVMAYTDFIRSLGLIEFNGTVKPAFTTLENGLIERGFTDD